MLEKKKNGDQTRHQGATSSRPTGSFRLPPGEADIGYSINRYVLLVNHLPTIKI
jgi:hypothetical protein